MKPATIFPLFLLGYLFVGAGVVYALHTLGASAPWLVSVGLIFCGSGLIHALVKTNHTTA